jgi:hypothetical protein
MSSALAEGKALAAPSEGAVLRQLAWIHAKRYATHPLYLIGVAFLVLTMTQMYDDASKDLEAFTGPVVVAFFIGVFGVIVAYRLTATEQRALDLITGAPVSATTRTLALCAACAVPAATGLAWLAYRLITLAIWPIRPELLDAMGGWVPAVAAIVGSSVVAALGGPLFGVAVGRWWRFPGAGVLATVLLVVPCFFFAGGAVDATLYDNVLVRMTTTAMPYTMWTVTSDAVTLIGVRAGSPVGYLAYTLVLCGLAVWAAVMRDAEGATRARWTRYGALLGVGALATYAWALLG